MIDANIFPLLLEILGRVSEFKTRKEAAWAVTNATSGGTPDQIRYLIEIGCIAPMCDLLAVMDTKILQVALNGIENILKLGDQDAKYHGGTNPYAVKVEECYGMYDMFKTLRLFCLSLLCTKLEAPIGLVNEHMLL